MLVSRPIVSRLFQQSDNSISESGYRIVHHTYRTLFVLRRYHNEHFKAPTMDELPVPRGSWQTQHDANQRRYNLTLLFGIAFTAGTLVVAKTSGLIYLNYSPPKSLD